MTAQQHDNAIEALAVLISRWLEHHPHPCPACEPDTETAGQLVAA